MGSELVDLRNPLQENTKEKCAINALTREDAAWNPVDSLDYRGMHVEFFEDPFGNQAWCQWKDKRTEFGADNTMYIDDMKSLIDDELDTVARFDEYPGAKLTWFDNGGSPDLKLVNWGRILKVWLVTDRDHIHVPELVYECETLLKYIKELEEK